MKSPIYYEELGNDEDLKLKSQGLPMHFTWICRQNIASCQKAEAADF